MFIIQFTSLLVFYIVLEQNKIVSLEVDSLLLSFKLLSNKNLLEHWIIFHSFNRLSNQPSSPSISLNHHHTSITIHQSLSQPSLSIIIIHHSQPPPHIHHHSIIIYHSTTTTHPSPLNHHLSLHHHQRPASGVCCSAAGRTCGRK